jgi:hypothetical protein
MEAATMKTDRGDETQPTATAATEEQPATRGPAGAGGRRPARISRPGPEWVFGGAVGAFFAALALLAVQVRAGADPALGPAEPAAQAPSQPREIVLRRVIRRVVVDPPRAARSADAAAVAAPEPAAPAPEPAAPAPAPLTTQSS